MKLMDCMITTATLDKSATVRDALAQCVQHGIDGLPFVDDNKRVTGRFSVRNMFYISSIPADLIKHAHLIGNAIEHLDFPDCHNEEFIAKPVSEMLLKQIMHLSPNSQIVKALALMEQYNTSYLFVVDDNEHYLGLVTRLSIAKRIINGHN